MATSLARLNRKPEEVLMDMDVDGDQLINLTEFRYFVKGLGLNLDQVEILNLY